MCCTYSRYYLAADTALYIVSEKHGQQSYQERCSNLLSAANHVSKFSICPWLIEAILCVVLCSLRIVLIRSTSNLSMQSDAGLKGSNLLSPWQHCHSFQCGKQSGTADTIK